MSKRHGQHWFPDIEGGDRLEGRRRSLQWVEEVFFRTPDAGQSGQFIGTSFQFRTAGWFLAFMGAMITFFLLRVFWLQIFEGDTYRALAERNRQRVIPIPAERGLLFDRHGKPLAENIPRFSLALVPQDLPRDTVLREQMVRRLSKLIGVPPLEIRELLHAYGSYSYESIIVQDNISYETALSIHIASADLPGIHIQRGSKRRYIAPGSLSHVLGYEGKLSPEELERLYGTGYLPSDTIGKTGIERAYEDTLRGVYGKRRIEVNALGREQRVILEEAPIPGRHITLTIDAAIEAKLESLMKSALERSDTRRAAAIALDPRNGEVLALVSLPTFDNNDFSGGITPEQYARYLSDPDQPLFHRAISGTYPSGSTIKPAIALAALAEQVITPHTSFLSVGGLQVGPWFFPDWLSHGHGVTDVRKALAWSVNTFFYITGGGHGTVSGLGVERIRAYLERFGFGKPLGIDLPQEGSGFVPSKEWKEKEKGERWYVGDTYNLSIGQGDLLVTPLQIAGMTAAIASHGTLATPHLAKKFHDPLSGMTEEYTPQTRSYGLEPSLLEVVRLGMRDCVIYGSCRRLASLPLAVAGKTGTAQWSSTKANHAWFTSFAPFEEPEIVLTLLVEEGEEGSRTAVPIAEEFYRWWWQYAPRR